MWVALKDDEVTVITSGKTVKDVIAKSQKKGYIRPILFRVPTKIIQIFWQIYPQANYSN